MGTPTRRAVLKGTAAFAGLAAVQASGLAGAASAAAAGTSSGHPKANVLLVHGAWVDGSSWSRVIAILQQRGYNVLAVQVPLTSLAEDVAWTRHVLAERLEGPTVLAGHSYGGAVISGAATGVDNVVGLVVGLVFASAFAPDSLGFLWFDPAAIPANFAQDLPVEEARVLAAVQKPIAARCLTDPAGPPAWKTLPSWFLVSTQDRMINPDLERFMAARIGARTVEVRPATPPRLPPRRGGPADPGGRPGRRSGLGSRPRLLAVRGRVPNDGHWQGAEVQDARGLHRRAGPGGGGRHQDRLRHPTRRARGGPPAGPSFPLPPEGARGTEPKAPRVVAAASGRAGGAGRGWRRRGTRRCGRSRRRRSGGGGCRAAPRRSGRRCSRPPR
jgi:Alpha/beta hydrolase family